eukprot:gb/GECG01000270.1/.p1 GENE.gb/GECG01000270.1/~~gb/GECG01000270.1/.p1  ORF type:complete len:333 (+),score=70.20 gb/GECG01000270.1/:1-999(+)
MLAPMKRSSPAAADDAHDDKRSKTSHASTDEPLKRRYKQPNYDVASIAPGKSGVLVPCVMKKEPRAAMEAMEMLNEMADELFPRKEEEAKAQGKESSAAAKEGPSLEEEENDIQRELQDEINQLQQEHKTDNVEPDMNLAKSARKRAFRQGRFAHLNFGIQAITLIVCLDSDIDVVKVVDTICEKTRKEKQIPSRYVLRMVPLQKLVKANQENVYEAVKELSKGTTLEDAETADTMCIKFKSRHSSSLKRDDVIKQLATFCLSELPNNKTDLKAGKTAILVEAIRSLAGVSVLDRDRFNAYAGYSVRILAETEEEAAKRKKQREDSESGFGE